MSRVIFLRLCLAAAVGFIGSLAPAQTRVLTTAEAVRSLSVAEAESGIEAVIRGVVVFVESPSGIFLQDHTSTTFFRTRPSSDTPLPAVGDEIEVRARTRMGLYLPGLDYPAIRHLGRQPLPAGIPASYDDLYFGRYHYRRVVVEGVVRSVAPLDDRRTVLRIALGSRVIEARVEKLPPSDRPLVEYRVRVIGLAAGFINARRQLVQPYLAVNDWSEVETLAPAPLATDVPLISAEELLAFRVSGAGHQRVRIEGVVTAVFQQELFLRQGVRGFSVRTARPTSTTPGDRVAVVGFPEMERFSASLVDAELVKQSAGPAPQPVELAGPEALDGPLDGMLVRLTGNLRDAFKADGGHTLLVAGATRTIQIRVPESAALPTLGSVIRATGICQVESAHGSTGFTSRPTLLSLRTRSAADLEVIRVPGWWTPRRLTIGLATLATTVLLAALWIALLRRQVSRQTAALGARIHSEAALAERQRIAREFHDTLEQELAGVSLRLDAVATRPIDEKGRSLITAARTLVSRMQTETRDLIADLRDPAEVAGDLPAALQAVAARHAADSGAEIIFESRLSAPPLPPAVVHDLRMIARESVTNALKHGRATQVRLELEEQEGALRLRVSDNGCGFNPATVLESRRGHFGCAGIRERARKIGAEVLWRSEAERGTSVEVTLPLRTNTTLTASSQVLPFVAVSVSERMPRNAI